MAAFLSLFTALLSCFLLPDDEIAEAQDAQNGISTHKASLLMCQEVSQEDIISSELALQKEESRISSENSEAEEALMDTDEANSDSERAITEQSQMRGQLIDQPVEVEFQADSWLDTPLSLPSISSEYHASPQVFRRVRLKGDDKGLDKDKETPYIPVIPEEEQSLHILDGFDLSDQYNEISRLQTKAFPSSSNHTTSLPLHGLSFALGLNAEYQEPPRLIHRSGIRGPDDEGLIQPVIIQGKRTSYIPEDQLSHTLDGLALSDQSNEVRHQNDPSSSSSNHKSVSPLHGLSLLLNRNAEYQASSSVLHKASNRGPKEEGLVQAVPIQTIGVHDGVSSEARFTSPGFIEYPSKDKIQTARLPGIPNRHNALSLQSLCLDFNVDAGNQEPARVLHRVNAMRMIGKSLTDGVGAQVIKISISSSYSQKDKKVAVVQTPRCMDYNEYNSIVSNSQGIYVSIQPSLPAEGEKKNGMPRILHRANIKTANKDIQELANTSLTARALTYQSVSLPQEFNSNWEHSAITEQEDVNTVGDIEESMTIIGTSSVANKGLENRRSIQENCEKWLENNEPKINQDFPSAKCCNNVHSGVYEPAPHASEAATKRPRVKELVKKWNAHSSSREISHTNNMLFPSYLEETNAYKPMAKKGPSGAKKFHKPGVSSYMLEVDKKPYIKKINSNSNNLGDRTPSDYGSQRKNHKAEINRATPSRIFAPNSMLINQAAVSKIRYNVKIQGSGSDQKMSPELCNLWKEALKKHHVVNETASRALERVSAVESILLDISELLSCLEHPEPVSVENRFLHLNNMISSLEDMLKTPCTNNGQTVGSKVKILSAKGSTLNKVRRDLALNKSASRKPGKSNIEIASPSNITATSPKLPARDFSTRDRPRRESNFRTTPGLFWKSTIDNPLFHCASDIREYIPKIEQCSLKDEVHDDDCETVTQILDLVIKIKGELLSCFYGAHTKKFRKESVSNCLLQPYCSSPKQSFCSRLLR